jgi:hypothetical protein
MPTVEQTVSTWGADIVRGLAHPESSAARLARIADATEARQLRAMEFDLALRLLRSSLRTEEQLCDLLHCAGTTLANSTTGTLDKQNVELIDALGDVIQYRTSGEVEALIDCVKGITTLEAQS